MTVSRVDCLSCNLSLRIVLVETCPVCGRPVEDRGAIWRELGLEDRVAIRTYWTPLNVFGDLCGRIFAFKSHRVSRNELKFDPNCAEDSCVKVEAINVNVVVALEVDPNLSIGRWTCLIYQSDDFAELSMVFSIFPLIFLAPKSVAERTCLAHRPADKGRSCVDESWRVKACTDAWGLEGVRRIWR